MKKFNLFILIAVFTLVSFSLSPSLFAEESTEESTEEQKEEMQENKRGQIEDYKNQLKEQKQEFVDNRVQNRCERAGKIIDNRIENYRNNESAHISVFNNLVTRVENLVTNLKNAGYSGDNLTKLENDLVTLEQKVKAFSDTYGKYISELEDTKDLACGESDGDYLDAVKNAQGDLTDLRLAAQDIRSFYIGTIKPDMLAIRQQIVSEKIDQKNDNESVESTN